MFVGFRLIRIPAMIIPVGNFVKRDPDHTITVAILDHLGLIATMALCLSGTLSLIFDGPTSFGTLQPERRLRGV